MKVNTIIREVLDVRRWTQTQLAKECGYASQGSVSNKIGNDNAHFYVDTMLKMLNTMGCEVVVRDKMGTGKEWVITNE